MAKLPLPRRIGRGPGPRLLQSDALWTAIVLGGLGVFLFASEGGFPRIGLPKIGEDAVVQSAFPLCGTFVHDHCVIDGDTFRYQGERIRIADIDAPETHPPRCDSEAALGQAATFRLQELLSDGPFSLRSQGRDRDQYGRKLRAVYRDGESLGATLVSEGLARDWGGRRLPWC